MKTNAEHIILHEDQLKKYLGLDYECVDYSDAECTITWKVNVENIDGLCDIKIEVLSAEFSCDYEAYDECVDDLTRTNPPEPRKPNYGSITIKDFAVLCTDETLKPAHNNDTSFSFRFKPTSVEVDFSNKIIYVEQWAQKYEINWPEKTLEK